MAKVVSFEIEINGIKTQINNLGQLEQTLKDVKKDAKGIGLNSEEITKYASAQAKLSVQQKKFREEVKKQSREIEAQDKTYRGLSSRLINLRSEAKDVAVQFGINSKQFKTVQKDVTVLDNKLKQIDTTLGQNQRRVGAYFDAFKQGAGAAVNSAGNLGIAGPGQLLSGIGGGPAGAITAILSGAGTAAKLINDLTLEYQQLNSLVATSTNLQAENIQTATIGIKSLSDTYQKDFNEVLTSANSLTQNFGIEFTEALDLIETGILSGADAQDDLLNKIKEYSIQVKNAGFTAEEFIKIATQEVRGGIYDDKVIDSIKEADLSLKELTKTQIDALNEAIGPEATQQLSERLKEGSITTKEALEVIAEGVEVTGADIQDLQELTSNIFKSAGEDAGGFGVVLQTVNQALKADLADLVDETDAYIISQRNLKQANDELASAEQGLAAQFAGTGLSVDQLTTKLKGLVTEGLSSVVRGFRVTKDLIKENGLFAGLFASDAEISQKRNEILAADKKALTEVEKGQAAAKKIAEERAVIARKEAEQIKAINKTIRTEIKKTEDIIKEGSIKFLTNQLADLRKEFDLAGSDGDRFKITDQIDELTNKIEILKNKATGIREVIDITTISSGLDATGAAGPIEGENNREVELNKFVNEQKATANQEFRDKELEEREAQLEAIAAIEQEKAAIQDEALTGIELAFSQFAEGQLTDFKTLQKELLKVALSALERTVQLAIAEGVVRQLATKGFVGIATGAAISGLITGAFAGVRSLVDGFADGGYTGPGVGKKDKTGYRVAGVVHESEYVIPKRVLNTSQGAQLAARAEYLRKGKFSDRAIVPHSFATGGLTSAPIAPVRGSSRAIIQLSDESISLIGDQVYQGSKKGSDEGTNKGITESTERSRRLSDLKELTEV